MLHKILVVICAALFSPPASFGSPSNDFPPGASARADFNGDGTPDLLLRHDDGRWQLFTLDGSTVLSNDPVSATQDTSLVPISFADFNADGNADILLRHDDGSWWLNTMDGATILSASAISGNRDLNWVPVSIQDTDNDGKADILLRNSSTGAWHRYGMDGADIMTSLSVSANRDMAWQPVSHADFNGDGSGDILLRNSDSGGWWLNTLNGPVIMTASAVRASSDLAWEPVSHADFNGDGNADILLRNTVHGRWWLYTMNGATVETGGSVRASTNMDWQPVSFADHDGNGKADILIRNNTNGIWWLYLMDGSSITAQGSLVSGVTGEPEWQPVATQDYNRDGSADILIRNTVNGRWWLYTLNGHTVTSTGGVGAANDLDWRLIPYEGFAPGDESAFSMRLVGKRVVTDDPANYTDFLADGRFNETRGTDTYAGNYTWENTGSNTGTLTTNYDDGKRCTYELAFATRTAISLSYTCDNGESGEANWRIVETVGGSPVFESDAGPGDQTYTKGRAISPLTLPRATGGDGTLTYSLLPEVPGLSFDAATRQLTGTPTTVDTYDMTYTVADDGGDTGMRSFTLTVQTEAAADRAALVALYNATSGADWTNNTNWLSDAPLSEWYGVTADDSGRVTRLSLNNQLSGGIPTELAALTNLEYLSFYGNQLSGAIPAELGELSNLTSLFLGGNQLSGAIPAELGGLANLTWLGLGDNELSGSIPAELGGLTNLQSINLWGNQLSGEIPAELGGLANLVELNLGPNQFSGSIPPELGGLTNLQSINLWGNQLSGEIPAELGGLANLVELNLGSNQFSGSIPPELGGLSYLSSLALGSNELSGSIPPELGGLSNLQSLNLSDNQLSESIPSDLGELSNLQSLDLYNNQLSGAIPSELGGLSKLTTLILFQNKLSGAIPSELGELTNLVFLWLQGNQLSGAIPPKMGDLSNLERLWLQNNQLSGSIPAELGELTNLLYLLLNENQLSGSIPAELGDLSNLRFLYLDNNQLSGSIPAELGDLSNLRFLSLDKNQLSGAIPAELSKLTNLTSFNFADNQLSGAIPSELGELTNLVFLWLKGNQLSGAIPPKMGDLSNLERLWLQNNQLSGSIPAELGKLTNLTRLSFADNQLSGSIPAELGDLSNLRFLYLDNNQLSGSIPAELGELTNLLYLLLNDNQLSGSIPSELGDLTNLRSLSLYNNQLSGTVPWSLWERVTRGELSLLHSGNAITGFEQPPQRTRPVFSGTSAENGNASHHSVSYYQGPLVWSWNWQDEAVEYQRPILGRWAALAVRIDHGVAQPPVVITRVLDSDDKVLAERLGDAVPPTTESTGSGRWRTEYVFDMPGSLYQAGNKLVHVIDPDNDLAETDETDNVGEAIRIYGDEPPQFRVTFIPLHFPGEEPLSINATSLMAGTRALLPIADNYQATVRSALQSDALDKFELLDEVRALWNTEAEPDEFYHGVFNAPWPGTDDHNRGGGGVAGRDSAVSDLNIHRTIPHEFGHNLSLSHPPGCDAESVDLNYPYPEGGLGPDPGWDVNWRRYVSRDDEGKDIMTYCPGIDLISDYHYRKASDYWLQQTDSVGSAANGQSSGQTGGKTQRNLNSVNPPSSATSQASSDSTGAGGLAMSGRVDASGVWSLTHTQRTEKGPRAPSPDGIFTLFLFDEDGVELYQEPLSIMVLSEGSEGGWAARTPIPQRHVRVVAIKDAQGNTVLREALPEYE